MRLVRYRVNTSPDIVDDACAFAWVQFMRSQPDRNRQWRGWLLTTAEREAWRMHREQARDLRADLTGDAEPAIEPEDTRDRQAARGDLRHALDLLAAVPERRRRAKALQLIGGGFGGLQAATHLTSAPVEPTLVDRRNFPLFQPLTYVIVGDDDSRAGHRLRSRREYPAAAEPGEPAG